MISEPSEKFWDRWAVPFVPEIMPLAVGPACQDGAVLWQSVSALCAGNTVFSDFLPVLSPETIVRVARARVFLTEAQVSEA